MIDVGYAKKENLKIKSKKIDWFKVKTELKTHKPLWDHDSPNDLAKELIKWTDLAIKSHTRWKDITIKKNFEALDLLIPTENDRSGIPWRRLFRAVQVMKSCKVRWSI